MSTRAAQEPVPDPAHGTVAWVVSPHDLVAQAVAEALRTTGAPAEFHAWEQLLVPPTATPRLPPGAVPRPT